MKRYFLGLSSTYSAGDTLRHTFATGSEYDLSELRAFLAAHYGATFDHAAVYSNGRTALNVAVKELVKRGGKVVVTSMTCYAVIQAIKNAGCVPIFADIDKDTLHFGKKELEKALEGENNVQAVLVQNNLGIPADIEGIEEVAKTRKLIIIEDLAHCAGVKYADGREAGTVGRATILSFGKGKSIDAVTGGAVVFTDPLDPPVNQPGEPPAFKDNVRARFYPLLCAIIRGGYRLNRKLGRGLTAMLVKMHAIKRSADGKIDQNLRLTFWQCKMALRQLKSLSHRGRKPIRDFYLVDDRDETLAELVKAGYEFHDIWYETPVAPERYFHKADFHPDACPVASETATKIVNVPTWYGDDPMRPALRIIKKHLMNEDDISDEELEITEAEKYQKAIEADKKAKKEATKKEIKEKLGKVAPKEVLKVAKRKKAESEKKSEEKQEKVKKTKEELAKEREEKRKEKAEQKRERELEKREKISKDRDDSGLLLAMEKAKEKAKSAEEESKEVSIQEQEKPKAVVKSIQEEEIVKPAQERSKEIAKPAQSVAKVEKSIATNTGKSETKTSASEEKRIEHKTSVSTNASATGMKKSPTMRQAKPKASPVPEKLDLMPGMRVAPEKLTAREKLKAEIEQGKNGGASVV